jgi:hypothetical protein
MVERTFGWLMHWRRLVWNYGKRIDVSEAMIHIALRSPAYRTLISLSAIPKSSRSLETSGWWQKHDRQSPGQVMTLSATFVAGCGMVHPVKRSIEFRINRCHK